MTHLAAPETDQTVAPRGAPSKATQLVLYVSYLVILTLLFVACAELIVRASGVEPWRAENDRVSAVLVDPGGRFFQKHPVLGYSHIPGRFRVTLGLPPSADPHRRGDRSLGFTATHLPNTLRITRPLDRYRSPEREEDIWIFGCSFTHGWSVNDEETYAWRLQERLPEHNVVNFGVSGYGTIHSLLQFRDALKTKVPRVVILAYAAFHDERNTFSRTRRKLIAPWSRLGTLVQPYARLDSSGRLQYDVAEVEYPEFPMMRYLALSHFIETKYNELELQSLRSHTVTETLILEMARLAKQHDVTFVVATINGTPMQDFYADNGISHIDISVDPRRPENTNWPFDSHPSGVAHRQYAEKLESFLKAELASTKEQP